jgi:hypothetical protein
VWTLVVDDAAIDIGALQAWALPTGKETDDDGDLVGSETDNCPAPRTPIRRTRR